MPARIDDARSRGHPRRGGQRRSSVAWRSRARPTGCWSRSGHESSARGVAAQYAAPSSTRSSSTRVDADARARHRGARRPDPRDRHDHGRPRGPRPAGTGRPRLRGPAMTPDRGDHPGRHARGRQDAARRDARRRGAAGPRRGAPGTDRGGRPGRRRLDGRAGREPRPRRPAHARPTSGHGPSASDRAASTPASREARADVVAGARTRSSSCRSTCRS